MTTAERVIDVYKRQMRTNVKATHTHEDLNFDSLDMIELVMAMEYEFGMDIADQDAEQVTSVGEAICYIYDRLGEDIPDEYRKYAKNIVCVRMPKTGIVVIGDDPKAIYGPTFNKKWRAYFFGMADHAATGSKDPKRKVGVVAVTTSKRVIGTGMNGFPIGVEDDPEKYPKRYEYPEKQYFMVHAGQNIVALAARHGVKLEGCSVFSTLQICTECTKMLIQAGVAEVYCRFDNNEGKWSEQWEHSIKMYKEAGVLVWLEA